MLVSISHTDNGYLEFNTVDEPYFGGPQLQGARLFTARLKEAIVQIQELSQLNFAFSYRFFDVQAPKRFHFQENKEGVRMEAVLSGNVELLNTTYQLFPGQYHFTNGREYSWLFKGQRATSIFVTYFSDEFLKSAGMSDLVKNNAVYQLGPEMSSILKDIVVHDYNERLRDFFYENCIRELLLCHLKQVGQGLPDQIDEKIIAAILRADAIMMESLSEHYTIAELAKLSGTNAYTLKKGYRQYFKMGLFERLSTQRLNKAKEQLQENKLSIEEISMEAGYQHVASFIKAFKKRFGITPLEWRRKFI